jgi:hypothetical protein
MSRSWGPENLGSGTAVVSAAVLSRTS